MSLREKKKEEKNLLSNKLYIIKCNSTPALMEDTPEPSAAFGLSPPRPEAMAAVAVAAAVAAAAAA